MKTKQPIFIISKANLFEAWLKAKRTSDKHGRGWDWGKGSQYEVLKAIQELPDKEGYVKVSEVADLLKLFRCHYAFPSADKALQGILTQLRPLREKLHEVEERIRTAHESRKTGYFSASYEGKAPARPEWGYVIRTKQ